MDTKKLVVGQEVELVSGVYGTSGKVVKITPDEVVVETPTYPGWPSKIVHLDKNGRSFTPKSELPDWYTPGCRWDGSGTYENGPWELSKVKPLENPSSTQARRKRLEEEEEEKEKHAQWLRDKEIINQRRKARGERTLD
jgi:hypothetical protein